MTRSESRTIASFRAWKDLEPTRRQNEDLVVVKPQLSPDPRPVPFGRYMPREIDPVVDQVDIGGLSAEPSRPPLVELRAGDDRIGPQILVGEARPTHADRFLLWGMLVIVHDERALQGGRNHAADHGHVHAVCEDNVRLRPLGYDREDFWQHTKVELLKPGQVGALEPLQVAAQLDYVLRPVRPRQVVCHDENVIDPSQQTLD